jgi:LuxR family maltose regulon positive regulatory protein
VVPRRALFELLAAGIAGGVSLISGPAGSGKTVLLRSWIAETGLGSRAAWVSVERGERDAQRFWLAVMRELRAAAGADEFVDKLAPAPEFDGNAVVERLVSEFGSLAEPVVLVIDDLHELSAPEARVQLERLLARRPPLLRVVLASRRDPQLGQLTGEAQAMQPELRASDLRFTLEETRELLAVSGITLSSESIALLHERTEGWAAGLRLAALSLAGHPEPERFVAEFSGSERTVAEYLLAEVLERQLEEVQRLLLCTSILERVNGALADILAGAHGSERILQDLEAANAFVVSLDAERSWFRYHHLFADLLRLELRRTNPDAVAGLHRDASGWYAEHGDVVEAIRHAQAARDWRQAARLLADHCISLWLDGRETMVGVLLEAFPAEAAADPELAPVLAADRLSHGSLDELAACVAYAERPATAVPDDRRLRFEATLSIFRLALALRRGDLDSALEDVRPMLALAEPSLPSEIALGNDVRAFALMELGMVEVWPGRYAEADRHL